MVSRPEVVVVVGHTKISNGDNNRPGGRTES